MQHVGYVLWRALVHNELFAFRWGDVHHPLQGGGGSSERASSRSCAGAQAGQCQMIYIPSLVQLETLCCHMHASSDIGSPLRCYVLNYCLSLSLSLQVSVFSPSHRKHYFNITPSNIIRIYPTNSGEKTSQAPLVYQLHTCKLLLFAMKICTWYCTNLP